MNLSFNWLRELAPGLEEDAGRAAERLSMIAAAVEAVEPVGESLEGVVVARVLEVRKHPNADRLSLCVVDAGAGEPIPVVCGAPIIVQGALYPYAGPGTTLPGGFTLESRKIRGEISHGMLCSEAELDLGRDRGGIMRLGEGIEPGTPLLEALGLPDARLSLDLNPNRVDLACHAGAARELAPGGHGSLAFRDFGASWEPTWCDGRESAEGAGVRVTIETPERCPRYLAAVIRGVRVGPSPPWLAGRLLAAGAQPINNVVDATNYVLLERNQPLHAFDLARLEGSEIRVRAGGPGEAFRTLDGGEHEMDAAWTVIADRDRAVALAGVMGGLESEVTSGTTDVLLECAAFEPLAVRGTARRAGLSTDASYRFERGIDEHGLEAALVRAVELVLAIAGGHAESEAVRAGPAPSPAPILPLRPARVRQVLGLELDRDELASILEPIGFPAAGDAEGGAPAFGVPGWRRDVTREIDLVEEIARRYGYDRFPAEPRRFRPSAVPEDPGVLRAARTRRALTAAGMLESRSLSFMPAEYRGSRAIVSVPNPLSSEESHLRHAMVPVLLRRLEHNWARGHRDVRLFEIGTVFDYDGPAGGGLERFREERRVGLIATGARHPRHWSGRSSDWDLWDLKGLVEEVAERLLRAVVEPLPRGDGQAERFAPTWLSGERFRIVREGATLGVAGSVDAASVDAPPWASPVWALEFDLAAVEPPETVAFRPLSAFPAVRRDLAITVPRGVLAGDVERVVREAAGPWLEEVALFDVYEGEEAGEGRRSLGWAFRFRARDRTLTDEEIEVEMGRIAATLEKRFDARIRTS